jgi:hypothetical protein
VRRAEGEATRRAGKLFQTSAPLFQSFPSFSKEIPSFSKLFPRICFGRFVGFQGLIGEKRTNRRSANFCGLSVGRRASESVAGRVSREKDSVVSYFQKEIVGVRACSRRPHRRRNPWFPARRGNVVSEAPLSSRLKRR